MGSLFYTRSPESLQLQPNHFPFLGLSLPEKEMVSPQRSFDICTHLGNSIPEISFVSEQSWGMALECLSVCLPYLVGLTLSSYGHSLGPWNRCPPHTSMDIHKLSSTRSSAVTCLSDFCGEGFKASFSTPLDFGPCPRKCFLNDRENTFQDTRANDSSPGLNTHPFSPCFYFCLPVSLMLSLMTQCHWTPGCPGSTPKVTPGCCFLHWARL